MTELITLLWSFSLYRLLTLKRSPVISLKHETIMLIAFGIRFFLILLIIGLIQSHLL